jgi:hypothetical protein
MKKVPLYFNLIQNFLFYFIDLYFDCVEQFKDDYDLIEQQECGM